MKKLKIYLDTSVYSALYDERDLNRQKQTNDFWNNIKDYDDNLFYYMNKLPFVTNVVEGFNLRSHYARLNATDIRKTKPVAQPLNENNR